ncbi:unnamed protein product [Mytilus coruscus]|uniref:C3H1-type domain-containing protein n=1 Tax=Mytilus coruscus TaxID=42192 RepID=A0A6J8CFN7_MYTCO|nr:unnamed protein product [Mytilus coruscus]
MAAPSASNVNNEVMTGILNSMQSMQGMMLGLQIKQTVININDRPITVDANNLSTAYAAMRSNVPGPSTSSGAESSQTFPLNGGYRFPISEFGVPSYCIPHVDIVSDEIKKRIWEGKDVYLAALRIELDRYEANIIDIYNVYGAKFYDYHCQFSARAAAALRDCNIKVDWSIKDTTMLSTCMVAGNAKVNSCSNCSSTMHLSSFCPQLQNIGTNKVANTANYSKSSNFSVKDVDRYGRKRVTHNETELCNNFNDKKCNTQPCQYAHTCSICDTNNHAAYMCSRRKNDKQNNTDNIHVNNDYILTRKNKWILQ